MSSLLDRMKKMSQGGLLIVAALGTLATVATAQGEPLPVGADGVLIIDGQHPALYTTLSHDVKAHHDLIDMVGPQRFDISDDGDIKPLGKKPTDWGTYVKEVHQLGIKVVPSARNLHHSSEHGILTNAAGMKNAVRNLTELCLKHDFDGINIDIEKLTAADRDRFTHFVSQLHQSMKAHNLLLMVAVGARAWDNQFDFVGLSQNSDGLRVMFYDYTGRWTKGKQPGPTAPMVAWPGQPNSIEADLDALIKMGVPRKKIVMGIPEYGVDFTLDEQGMVATAKPSWNSLLRATAKKHKAEIKWDERKQGSYFNYTDKKGAKHQVWLESARSYQAKLDLVRSRGIAGIITWASAWPDKATDKAFWPTAKQWLSAAK